MSETADIVIVGGGVIIGESEVMSIQPNVERGTFVGAAWGPTDGFIRPLEILRGYREASLRMGVTFQKAFSLVVSALRPTRFSESDPVRGSHLL